jgi:hypothetical protein
MSEFWVDRPTAELELQSYLTDFGNQLSKAILITGMPGSGKSYLTYKLGSMIEPKRNVYTISPPENGSVDLAVFQRCLLDSIELSNIDDIEENIKPNSLIIFEDTELWWKKTVNGYQVIDFIHELIEQFQHRYLFAVVINSFAMEIISQVRPLTQVYSHFVQLDFLDAHALQKMIWKRHLAGGMKLQLKNKHQDSFHAWDFASLFGKYFQYSKGYPLVAMEAWMQNMTHFDGKLLDIDLPKNFDASVLELMDEHSLWFVQLFLLHKQLDISKIILLTLMEDSEVNSRIFELKRIGIIVEQNNGVFVLNNLIIPYLVQVLKTKKRLS